MTTIVVVVVVVYCCRCIIIVANVNNVYIVLICQKMTLFNVLVTQMFLLS